MTSRNKTVAFVASSTNGAMKIAGRVPESASALVVCIICPAHELM